MAASPEVKLTIKQAFTLEAEDPQSSDNVEMTEERMRRALGLGGPSGRPILTTKLPLPRQEANGPAPSGSARHKLDSVGGSSAAASAPSPLQQRAMELERQLAAERQKHKEACQLLQRAEFAVRHLETRSQHDALAQQEELDRERQATVRAQRALDDALFELQQRTEARRLVKANTQGQVSQTAVAADQALAPAAKPDAINSTTPAADASSPKKRGRPRTHPLPEPKPVRWWTPSFRAKMKR